MSTRRNWNRGMPWIYVALAIGGVVAAVSALFLGALLVRPTLLSGSYQYPWFPFGFFWIIPAIIVIFFVSRWFFWGWGWGGWRYYSDDPRSILAERYARGELTRERYEQMKKDLEQS